MSTVIKAGEAGKLMRRLSTVDLADHLAEADAVIQAARHRADRIVTKAEKETESGLRDAKRTGYDKGFKEGREAGFIEGCEAARKETIERFEQEQAHVVGAIQQAVEAFDAMKQGVRIAAEHDVLQLAVQIATKLTYEIGRLDHESAKANVTRAIDLIGERTDMTIYVHPDDAEALRVFADTMMTGVERARSVRIMRDESLVRGGCRVSGGGTDIDASLDTQVEEVVSLLLGRGGQHG